MQSTFQKILSRDKETIWKIIKVFHPNIPEVDKKGKSLKESIEISTPYDWVAIGLNYPGGRVHISITNCKHHFYGSSITSKNYIEAVEANKVRFNVTVHSMDSTYEEIDYNYDKNLEEFINSVSWIKYPEYRDILVNAGYDLKPTKEFMRYYYED
jgi:hypothetical protein